MKSLALFAVSIALAACADQSDVFVPEPDDETIDPADPPIEPDPDGTELGIPTDEDLAGYGDELTDEQAIAVKAKCPKRSNKLSPDGLTFVIHISKHEDEALVALRQLRDVRHLIRARDIFMVERKTSMIGKLRRQFPCNDIHFIAYPEELDNAFAAASVIDGIAVDWERSTFHNTQGWSIDKLLGYASKIRSKNLVAGVVPFWPNSFDDGHIVNKSKMGYDLAQIQDHCVAGPLSFGGAAKQLVKNFMANGLSARDIGFEISLNSYDDAANHTVDPSAKCTRKAYGKGARAIYLYGNGHPHLDKYFRKLAAMGVRRAN